MTEEQIRKPYYDDKLLAELQKEIQTVPADGEGKAVAVHYNEMFVRSTVLKLINDILTLQQQNKQLIEALKFYAAKATYDIEHLNKYGYIIIDNDGGEKARSAIQQIQGNIT